MTENVSTGIIVLNEQCDSNRKATNILMCQTSTFFSNRNSIDRNESCCGLIGRISTIGIYCCTLLSVLVILILLNGVSIACICVGSIYLDEKYCPADSTIAPALLATGILTLIISIFEIHERTDAAKKSKDTGSTFLKSVRNENTNVCFWIKIVLILIKTALFIYMNIVVFRIHPNVIYSLTESTNIEQVLYCHPTLYIFSFWILIYEYIIMGILILSSWFCLCLIRFDTSLRS